MVMWMHMVRLILGLQTEEITSTLKKVDIELLHTFLAPLANSLNY